MINHRSLKFTELLRDCERGLQWALGTDNDVLIFPSSGTGAMEATVANLISPGDHLLVCSVGWFGELWGDIAASYGAHVIRLRSPWGQAIDPHALEAALVANPRAGTVFVTHNETSTGVTNDLRILAPIVKRHGRLLAVDAIGGAACLPLAIDELGLDVVVMASQKGWLSPPGLSMVAVSSHALQLARMSGSPRWYLDFHRQRHAQHNGSTHTTPALAVMYALAEGLAMLREEGKEAVWARHRRIAGMIRSGLELLELELFADNSCRSDSVTAVRSPFDSADQLTAFVRDLDRQQHLVLANGHGPLRGNIFRVGHMGMIDEQDAQAILQRIARVLRSWPDRSTRPASPRDLGQTATTTPYMLSNASQTAEPNVCYGCEPAGAHHATFGGDAAHPT